jgi:hypothetical protein
VTFPGEIAHFKVFPAGARRSRCYWTVLVFANKGHMRRAYRKLNLTDDHDDRFGAIVMPQDRWTIIRGRRHIVDPSLGYVLFARTQLCMETQCHESIHMAISFLRRIDKFPRLQRKENNDGEETLAYYAGRCARRLNNSLYKFHCYRK